MQKAGQNNRTTKAERLQAILRLIKEHPINRQEELLQYLRAEGFVLTQATVSRDIRELCLVKAIGDDGSYRYISGKVGNIEVARGSARFETIFREAVLSAEAAGHLVVVKCYSGMANAACGLFDDLRWANVVGTLSGDDTFFIVARTEHDARAICAELTNQLE